MVGKKRKGAAEPLDAPVDLASRIGMPGAPATLERPERAAPEPHRRVDGPLESSRGRTGRPQLIGANEPVPAPIPPPTIDGVVGAARPGVIGLDEALAESVGMAPAVAAPAAPAEPSAAAPTAENAVMEYAPLAATVREAPAAGEMDLVVTPLPTPDDWHHFELALRRLPGVGALRIEYYRHGILKLRVRWSGGERFAEALARVPGYRVGILGEDRTTVQIRVAKGA